MKRNNILFVAIFFSAMAVTVITGCTTKSSNPSETLTAPEKKIDLLELRHGSISSNLEIPGELLAFEKIDLFPRVSGFISLIRVDRGSKVKKGDVLVFVDAPELQAELAEAVAKKNSAESQVYLRLASFLVSKDTYQRMLRLSATQGAISQSDLLLYKTRMAEDSLAHQSAIMGFKAATAAAEAKQQLIAYLTIRAPFDGIITDRMVHPGALVKPELSKPMFRMSNIGTLRLELAIPEAYAGKTTVGDTVLFITNLQDRFVVTVSSNGQHKKVSVVNGLQNGSLTQIGGDLAAGDEILLNAREFYQ